MHQSEKRDILRNGICILAILFYQTGIPLLILADDIFRSEERHRCDKHHYCPNRQGTDELHLMLGEEEKGQSHNAIEFNKCAQHDEEGSPEILFFLDAVIGQYNDGGNGNIELLHIKGCQQLMGTEPQHKQLLVAGKLRLADGDVEKHAQRHTPQQQAHEQWGNGERLDDH